jgi:hypothetical protein
MSAGVWSAPRCSPGKEWRLNYSKLLRVCPPSLALALLVSASALPYIFGLGFYSDDWAFLAAMSGAVEQGLGDLYANLNHNPNLQARPVQIIQMILLYKVFGLEPLGYHLVNTFLLVAATVLMHLSLRRLQFPAPVTFAVALMFALSPAYSTNRFWFASFGYILMMALYFLSLYADLRALHWVRGSVDWRWKAVALAALAVCGLGYEVATPLLAGNLLLLASIGLRRRPSGAPVLRPGTATMFFGSSILVLGIVLAFKVVTAIGVGSSGGMLRHLFRLGGSATVVHLGSYGIALPSTTRWAAQEANTPVALAAIAIGILTAVYVALLCHAHGRAPRSADGLRMLTFGVLALVLGYAIFLATPRFSATSTGLVNRIHVGGAVGVAFLVVAAVSLLASRSRWSSRGPTVFAVCVGLLAMSFTLTIGAISTYWIEAYRDQQAILGRIEVALPDIPPGATIILAGQCPYRGPAVVFESSWDLSSALSLRYGDGEIAANVVTPRLEVRNDALTSTIYGVDDGRYPFGPKLYLYDDREGSVRILHDLESAKAGVGRPGIGPRSECAAGAEGWGEPVLPFERLLVTAGWIEPGLR